MLGSVYSGACLLPGFRFLGNFLWRCVSLCLISVMAFGCNGSAWKRGGIFLLLSMSMGGIALSLGRGDMLTLVLCGLICLFSNFCMMTCLLIVLKMHFINAADRNNRY